MPKEVRPVLLRFTADDYEKIRQLALADHIDRPGQWIRIQFQKMLKEKAK